MAGRYRLVRIEQLKPTAHLEARVDEAESYPVVEYEPKPGKKYAISIEVGDLPPSEVVRHMARSREALKDFFPEGSVLLIPSRNGHPSVVIYELEQVVSEAPATALCSLCGQDVVPGSRHLAACSLPCEAGEQSLDDEQRHSMTCPRCS